MGHSMSKIREEQKSMEAKMEDRLQILERMVES